MYTTTELVRYPLVIDPAVTWLEVLMRAHLPKGEGDSTRTYWCPLRRVKERFDTPLLRDNDTPHFFGNSKRLRRCTIVLAYGPTGRIVRVWRRRGRDWDWEFLPEERTGGIMDIPSLRLMFRNTEKRDEFVDLLMAIASATAYPDMDHCFAKIPLSGPALADAALRNARLISVVHPVPCGDSDMHTGWQPVESVR